jgi:hypothetical protein
MMKRFPLVEEKQTTPKTQCRRIQIFSQIGMKNAPIDLSEFVADPLPYIISSFDTMITADEFPPSPPIPRHLSDFCHGIM